MRKMRKMRKMKMSYSKLSTFEQCPLKFKYQYLDEMGSVGSIALTFGSAIHSMLEKIYDVEKKKRTEATFKAIFNTEWKKQKRKNNLHTVKEEDAEIYLRMEKMIHNFMANELFSGKDPVQREQFVEMKLDGNIEFLGRVDRLDKDGNYTVIDYKTGKLNLKYIDFTQLYTYALLLHEKRINVKKSLFYYIESDEIVEKEITKEILEQTKEELTERSQAVYDAMEADLFLPEESVLCGWCDFKGFCPAKQNK